MKNKQVKDKQIKIDFDINWEKISALEASLRKIINEPNSLPLSQEYFELMIKSSHQIINVIGILKNEQKQFQIIQDNYNLIQVKLSNHENIISSMEKNHFQRMKAVSDEAKNTKQHFDKAKRSLVESEEQAKMQAAEAKKQNSELKIKVEILLREKQQLLRHLQTKNTQLVQLKSELTRLKNILSTNQQEKPISSSFDDIVCSNMGYKLLQYLSPPEIYQLELLNKRIRIHVTKSKTCQTSLCRSIKKVMDRRISYYHRHIDYFEKLSNKIPQQILQTTFYSFEIAKQQIGTEILSILNSSALLFEGKFTDVEEELPVSEHQLKEEDLEKLKEETYLQIDEQIVKEFYDDKKNKKQKVNKEIVLMYKKIQDTAQLYSADVESIGLFLKNVLKNFSKVFVLSKNLYTQARNLQSLNTFLLSQLSQWDKSQVKTNSLIEDLKAELEAQKKLRSFFTQKGIKSQQRALNEQNIKLGMEMKYNKQIQKLDQVCREKEELKTKIDGVQSQLKQIQTENKEIRRAYENGREKYNKIIEQLGVVKETILRMNIM